MFLFKNLLKMYLIINLLMTGYFLPKIFTLVLNTINNIFWTFLNYPGI